MTLKQLIEYLTKLAANARSAHVRRVAPFVALIGDGIDQLGVHWEIHYMRQVLLVVGKRRIVVSYRHPRLTPSRRRGGIYFHEQRGNRLVREARPPISTLDDAIAFKQNPRI